MAQSRLHFPRRRLGECGSQGWPIVVRSGQDCEKKQSLSHEPELPPKIASNEEPLWGFWKDLFLLKHHLQRPLGCFSSDGFLDFKPDGSGRDTGIKKKELQPVGLAVGLYNKVSMILLYHIGYLTLSNSCYVSVPWFPHLWKRSYPEPPPRLSHWDDDFWRDVSLALSSFIQGDLLSLLREAFMNWSWCRE